MSSPSQATLGYSSTFATGATVSGATTYTTVLEIASISASGFTVGEVDVTTLASPGSTMESIPGLIKPGTIELTGNFIGDTTQLTLTTLGQARTVFPWEITSVVGGGAYTLKGSGFVSKLTHGPFKADSKIDVACTINIVGAIVETVA